MNRAVTLGILVLCAVGISEARHFRAARSLLGRFPISRKVRTVKFTGPPPFDQTQAKVGDPPVTALRATVIDASTGQVLWARNPDLPSFPASTTKIMTALVFTEHTKPEDVCVAPDDIQKVGEASLHLMPGETLTAENLLHGLLLRSANDGCVMAAIHVAGSVAAFAELMNKKAVDLGCTNTHFVNPNGLHDPNHTTTVHDLALMGRAALADPRIAPVVGVRKTTIQRSINTGDEVIVSKDVLLDTDPTCVGIKTGWTIPAGHCFVGAFNRAGTTVVTAVMGSMDWKADTSALADYATQNFNRQTWVTAGQDFGKASVAGGASMGVEAVAESGSSVLVRNGETVSAPVVHFNDINAPITQGQVVGYLVLPLPGNPNVNLVAQSEVRSAPVPSNSPLGGLILGSGVVGLAVAGFIRSRGLRRGR